MGDSWDLMKNWRQLIPPSRPSSEQLAYLVLFASKFDKSRPVAVLGSTMEFRDLLYELGFQNIFVFDRNEWFYENSSIERIYKNKEVFVHGDWLETLQAHPTKFELIVSDLTSGNIPYEQRKKFYFDIENGLVEGGHFFDKVLTHQSFLSVKSLIEKYERMPVNNLSVNYFSCEFLFCSELLLDGVVLKGGTRELLRFYSFC
jgi:hypothetical protein